MSAARTFFALGSLTHGYGVNADPQMAEVALAAAEYLGMPGDPAVEWESFPAGLRKALIWELRTHPGVTSYDLIRLVPESVSQRPSKVLADSD